MPSLPHKPVGNTKEKLYMQLTSGTATGKSVQVCQNGYYYKALYCSALFIIKRLQEIGILTAIRMILSLCLNLLISFVSCISSSYFKSLKVERIYNDAVVQAVCRLAVLPCLSFKLRFCFQSIYLFRDIYTRRNIHCTVARFR